MEHTVSHGWQKYGKTCFFAPQGVECHQMLPWWTDPGHGDDDSRKSDIAAYRRSKIKSKFASDHTKHTDRLMKYHYTEKAATSVAQHYAKDFEILSYSENYEKLCPGCYAYAEARKSFLIKEAARKAAAVTP